MGPGKRPRLKSYGLLKNRNLFQKVPSQGRCVSARCRALAVQAERYRTLNEEFIRENAALRVAEKSNREFSVMFDRFLLKMGQSIPSVQGMKKHLELAYDALGQIETMVNCFSDAESLRKFLIGEESFMFEPIQNDAKEAPRSPIVKEAPPREHRRFDEEGEIETILERTTENEENLTVNSPLRARSTFVKAPTQCLETPAVPQRRSSRRSSIGIPRGNLERTQNKISLDALSIRKSASSSKNSDNDSFEKRTELWREKPSDSHPRSSARRATYVAIPSGPPIFVSGAESGRETMTMRVDGEMNLEDKDLSRPTAGKSDEDLTGCFERTVTETKLPSVELPQIHEKSPTAINVAQIWANANALRPLERSPSFLRLPRIGSPGAPPLPKASMSIAISPSTSSLLATTQFPSPVLCEKESGLPTSTPAVNKVQNPPTTPPEVSIIVAESPAVEPTVVKNVDCRRRKPNLASARKSSPQFSSALPKSVRFSSVQDDADVGDRAQPRATFSKASVSSPFVERVRNTRIRQQAADELGRSLEDEGDGTPKLTNRPRDLEASPKQPASRRTFVKKKASAAPAGRKRSQRQSSKIEAPREAGRQSNENSATLTGDDLDPPSPKRVRVGSGQPKEALSSISLRASSSRMSRDTFTSGEETLTDSRRKSRRKPGVSYAEPSLRTKMRRDR